MTPLAGFEYFDVAADVGVVARGASLAEAAGALGRGVFNLIVPLEAVEAREERKVAVEGVDEGALLVNWVNELLYLHDVEGWVVARIEVEVVPPRLTARLVGESFDPARHPRGTVVKAATFHNLAIQRDPEGSVTLRMVLDV